VSLPGLGVEGDGRCLNEGAPKARSASTGSRFSGVKGQPCQSGLIQSPRTDATSNTVLYTFTDKPRPLSLQVDLASIFSPVMGCTGSEIPECLFEILCSGG